MAVYVCVSVKTEPPLVRMIGEKGCDSVGVYVRGGTSPCLVSSEINCVRCVFLRGSASGMVLYYEIYKVVRTLTKMCVCALMFMVVSKMDH